MKIINFGSLNIDRVYEVANFVLPGETILSRSLKLYAGGKGLNQSIAAARAGASVIHAGAVGPEGGFLVELLSSAGVDVQNILKTDTETGHAVIQVDSSGQNSIIVFGGANQCLTQEYIGHLLDLGEPGDLVLLQNEVNSISDIIRCAHDRKLKVVFNPSPFPADGTDTPFELVDYYMINEIEGSLLAGLPASAPPEEILHVLSDRYPSSAFILTLGGNGVVYKDGSCQESHASYKVPVVDTTAAGDTFCGYFLAGLCSQKPVSVCLEEASAAAAIAVSRTGAAPSIPTYSEVASFIH